MICVSLLAKLGYLANHLFSKCFRIIVSQFHWILNLANVLAGKYETLYSENVARWNETLVNLFKYISNRLHGYSCNNFKLGSLSFFTFSARKIRLNNFKVISTMSELLTLTDWKSDSDAHRPVCLE